MKFLSVILTAVVLLLSVKPCCADDGCSSDDGCTQTEQAPDHQHHNECKGDCSPFFNCGSCTGFTFPAFSKPLAPDIFIRETLFPAEHPSFLSGFSHAIWQPPKIN